MVSVVFSDVFFNALSMANVLRVGNYSLIDIYKSKVVQYILNDCGLSKIFATLDSYFLNYMINERIVEHVTYPYYIYDELHERSYLLHGSTGNDMFSHVDRPVIENNIVSFVQKNMWYNNNVKYYATDSHLTNYTLLPQYDQATSIFEMEKGSWDATYFKLKREPLELYKLQMMYKNYYSLDRYLGFVRETIGRIMNVKNRGYILKPKRQNCFRYDDTSKDSIEVQWSKFLEKYPSGMKCERMSVNDILIGQWPKDKDGQVCEALTQFRDRLNKITVCFVGYGSNAALMPASAEVYVSRARDLGEFLFELKCLLCYVMYNSNVSAITMLNPRMSQIELNKYLSKAISAYEIIEYSTVNCSLVNWYQHLLELDGNKLNGCRINSVYVDDMFAILKGTVVTRMKFKIGDGKYVHLLDYRKSVIDLDNLAFSYSDGEDLIGCIKFIDSSYSTRSLEVLGLIEKTVSGRFSMPDKYVLFRTYCKELARQITMNADYVVQKILGSFQNMYSDQNVNFPFYKGIIDAVMFACLGGNLDYDNGNVVYDRWVRNCFLWSDEYFVLDKTPALYGVCNTIYVTRRFDWIKTKQYIPLPVWNFGDVMSVFDRTHNNTSVSFTIRDDAKYDVLRNTLIRYSILYGNVFSIFHPRVHSIIGINIRLDRAISTNLCSLSSNPCYYMCEIPTMYIFEVSKEILSSKIHVLHGRVCLRAYWLNIVSAEDSVSLTYSSNVRESAPSLNYL
nr:MAG: hypothetical protein [Totiviridae sp.]